MNKEVASIKLSGRKKGGGREINGGLKEFKILIKIYKRKIKI